MKSLKVCEEIGDKKGVASSYNNIGLVYFSQGNYTEALKNFLPSLKTYKKIEDKLGLGASYNNIGNVYTSQGNYTEALKNHYSSLKTKEEVGDKIGVANSYSNIGIVNERQSNYNEALKNYFISLKTYIELGNNYRVAINYISIGKLYTKLNNLIEAKKYLNEALSISKKIGSKEEIKDIYISLKEIDSLSGNWKGAFENHKLYILYRDSIFNKENTKKITQAEMQYKFDKKEIQQKFEQEKELAVRDMKISKMNYFIFILVFLVLISTVLGYFVSRKIKLQSKLKNIQLEQRLLQSQMNPHFIFNALSSIQNLIYMNENDTAVEYLAKLAKLIRRILENSRQEYISIDREVTMLQHYMELQSLRFKNKFDFVIETAPALLEETISIPPMLAQPFIENAIEHGIMHKEGKGNIKINFNRENDMLIFEVIDNGVGREKSALLEAKSKRISKHISLATAITEERLANINKSLKKKDKIKISIIDLKDDNGNASGTKVLISIPIIE